MSKPFVQAGPPRSSCPEFCLGRLLNIPKHGDYTTSLGNLCQYSVTLTVKEHLCHIQRNLLCFSLLPQGHIAGSSSTLCPPRPPGPFLQSFFSSLAPCSAYTSTWVYFSSGAGLLLVGLHEVPGNLFTQPVEVCLDGSTTLWCISHCFQFSVRSKHADASSSRSLIKMLNRTRPSIDP